MILTKEQAAAIYRAMCELNNIGAKLNTQFDKTNHINFKRVFEPNTLGGVTVVVCVEGHIEQEELYTTQADFAAAYGVE